MSSSLRVEGLHVRLGEHEVLHGIDLDLRADRSVAVTGPSGSGKTTLLYALAGLERPSAGRVEALGTDLASLDPDALSEFRLRSFGFVFQSADLVPELSLRENVALPLELLGHGRGAVRRRVDALIDVLDLGECQHRRPGGVSGGQAQRAAVGRAVVAEPSVVLADEPTGALDSVNRDRVMTLLLEQARMCGALLVVVTHDHEIAARCTEQVGMVDGAVPARVDLRG